MTRNVLILSLVFTTLLSCGGDKKELAAPIAGWQQGLGPLPDDSYFSDSVDATFDFPADVVPGLEASILAMNGLEAWSGVVPLEFTFSSEIQTQSVIPGASVRLFYATSEPSAGRPVAQIVDEIPPADYTCTVSGNRLSIQPLAPTPFVDGEMSSVPFHPGSTIVVALTSDLLDSSGAHFQRDKAYSEMLVRPHPEMQSDAYRAQHLEQLLTAAGVAPGSLLCAKSFAIQELGAVLGLLHEIIVVGNEPEMYRVDLEGGKELDPRLQVLNVPLGATEEFELPFTHSFSEVLGFGEENQLFQGVLEVPYLLGRPNGTEDNTFLAQPWQSRFTVLGDTADSHAVTPLNPFPKVQYEEQIPLLVSLPKGSSPPPGGYPVVVFQHDLFGSRLDALEVADQFAKGGLALVAIDLPLHGVDYLQTSFYEGSVKGDRYERTFGLDLMNNSTGEYQSDFVDDPSGHWFLNLENPAVMRDNYRQSVVDLLSLLSALSEIDADSDDQPDFDMSRVTFLGHSFGAVIGLAAMQLEPAVSFSAAALAMPFAGWMDSLKSSQTWGPIYDQSLLAMGLGKNTLSYNRFSWFAQTLHESIEPAALVGDSLLRGHAALEAEDSPHYFYEMPIYLIEMVGNNGSDMPDKVVPNRVAGNPWAGTEPLISLLELESLSTSTVEGPVRACVRFVVGHHDTLLSPVGEDGFANATSQAAHVEMLLQTYSFLNTSGQELLINDESVVLQPE